jgi:hypothetical protein
MTRRAWLRHPATPTRRPFFCPTRLPRFANIDRALDALTPQLGPSNLTAASCDQCGGAHLVPRTEQP